MGRWFWLCHFEVELLLPHNIESQWKVVSDSEWVSQEVVAGLTEVKEIRCCKIKVSVCVCTEHTPSWTDVSADLLSDTENLGFVLLSPDVYPGNGSDCRWDGDDCCLISTASFKFERDSAGYLEQAGGSWWSSEVLFMFVFLINNFYVNWVFLQSPENKVNMYVIVKFLKILLHFILFNFILTFLFVYYYI